MNKKKLNYMFKKIENLYSEMDTKYQVISNFFNFNCSNCNNNCCSTTFYHHTIIEYFYLLKGFNFLPKEHQTKIKNLALAKKKLINDDTLQYMCPLNEENLCTIYKFRPMICRLHGLPHEIILPNKKRLIGDGCHQFENQKNNKNYTRFNRTSLYQKLAKIEIETRQILNINKKMKVTITEMIINGCNL